MNTLCLPQTPHPLLYGSVCSGIEAVSVAWRPIGLQPAWFAEIEPFASAVLAQHYPDVPNLGDMTQIASQVLDGSVPAPDILVGGTPCQSFSVAGARQGLADPRGALTLKYVELANAIDHTRTQHGHVPAVIVWENVPGVLSSKDNAFGCFLGALVGESIALQPPGGRWTDAGCVYGPQRSIAWRVLDAQYFGLAQRRKRVFLVASARSGFDPSKVLFEFSGLRRDSAPSRDAGQIAPTIPARSAGGGGLGTDFECGGGLIQAFGSKTRSSRDIASSLAAHGPRHDFESETFLVSRQEAVTHTLRGEGFDASEDGTGRGTPLVPVHLVGASLDSHCIPFDTTQVTSKANYSRPQPGDPCHPLASAAHPPAIAFDCKASGQFGLSVGPVTGTLRAMGGSMDRPNGGGQLAVATLSELQSAMQVRRLTPRECERLQGFPDDYTLIAYGRAKRLETMEQDWLPYLLRGGVLSTSECTRSAADGPRYKAIGNSMATLCLSWIGKRLMRSMR